MTTIVPTATAGLSGAARALLERRAARRDGAEHIPRRSDPSAAPLSVYQQRLWLSEQLYPGTAGHNRLASFRIIGPLDHGALERAIATVMERHEALRTVIAVEGDVPVARARHVGRALRIVDLRPVADGERIDRRDALMMEEMRSPFDLTTGPLLRATLLRVADDEHTLVLTQHHSGSDGWSDGVLFGELSHAYDAFLRGAEPSLAPLAIQYGDFAAWQRERERTGGMDRDLAFWNRYLADVPTGLDLPTDAPRPTRPTFDGAIRRRRIPRADRDALETLARAEKSTLAMALLSVTQVLLARYAGQTDFIVGVPIAGRTRPELEPLIGFFSNTLPIRADLRDDPSFRMLLRRVRDDAVHAYDHQDVPIDLMLGALRTARGASGAPSVQVMLNVRNMIATPLELTGAAVAPIERDVAPTEVDLSIEIVAGAEELECSAIYATTLFEATTADRILAHFAALVHEAAAQPDLPVSRLRMLDTAERERAVTHWNTTERALGGETTLHELVEQQAARTPNAVAVSDERGAVTYASLVARASRLASELQRRGVGEGSLVAVCMERSTDLSVALLAILQAGGAYVPLDPSLPDERFDFMLADSHPVLILTDHESSPRVDARGVDHVVVDATYCDALPVAPPRPLVAPGATAYVIYTSGSTGRPKGVLNTHRAICNRLLWMQAEYDLRADDVVLQKTPVSFDVSVWELFWPLLAGARLVMARPEGHLDMAYLAGVIAAEHVTTVHFVPPMLHRFLEETDPQSCVSLRHIVCSGEALPIGLARRVAERLPHVLLHNLYGPTEAAVDVSFWQFDPRSPRSTVPIGRPIANVRLYVLDQWMEPVPVGVTGELYIGGVAVAKGYLNRPDLTAERFVPDPFVVDPDARLYRTGDMVRQDAAGVVEYLGRSDHQVKIQGVRIELGEVEAILATHPAVRECAVVTTETKWGERRLAAYVVPRGGRDAVHEPSLREHMRARVPDVLVPSTFTCLEAMPLTPSGKTDRRALPTPAFVEATGGAPYRAPRTPTEVILARLWCDVLRIERVGVFDDFFLLGGRSMEAARVVGRLRTQLGVPIPIRALFEHPTIAELAPVLATADATPRSPLVCMQRGTTERSPLFLLHGDFNGGGLYCRALVEQLGRECPVYTLYPHEPGARDSIEAMADDYVERIRLAAAGPYLLAGYCNGAAVAYEIACRLRSAGEEVTLLALIDAAAPHALLAAIHRVIHGGGRLLGFDAGATREAYQRVREHAFRLSELLPPRDPRPSIAEWTAGVTRIVGSVMLGAGRRLWRAITGRGAGDVLPTDESPDVTDVAAILEERSAWYRARVRDYVPPRFDGKVTLIQPDARIRRRLEDHDFNWTRCARDVEVHTVPGTHLTIVGDGLDALATTLRASMERATASIH